MTQNLRQSLSLTESVENRELPNQDVTVPFLLPADPKIDMALHASMDNNRLTLALRIPRVGVRTDLRWDGVTLTVAVRVKGKIYCLHIDTVRRRESDIIELAMTFMLNADDLIDAMNRQQFPSLLAGVETLRSHGMLHETITDVTLVWCTTGRAASIMAEDQARWTWIDDLPPPVEWRRNRT